MSHQLTTIDSDSIPSQCIVMDTEIDTERAMGDPQGTYYAKLVRGVRWRYEDGKVSRSTESAALSPEHWWDWCAKQCRKGTVTWVFAYDLLRQLRCNGFMELLSCRAWQLTTYESEDSGSSNREWNGFAVLADPPTILVCRAPGKRGTVKMVDLRNYGIGKRSDIAGEADWVHGASKWVQHAIDWIRGNRLGSLQCTAGSQAMHSFRRRFLGVPIECNDHDHDHAIESASFYGGRCECRRIGEYEGPIYHLDVNSLYPSACIDLPVPVELIRVNPHGKWEDPLSLPNGQGMISSVRIATEIPLYPYRRSGLVIYPVGTFDTVLAGPELTDACTFGHAVKFGTQAVYRCEPILSDYMEWLYSQRVAAKSNGQHAIASLIKRMLVGLPGKFIQQDRQWVADPTRKVSEPWRVWREVGTDRHEVHQYRAFGYHVQREHVGGFADTAIPAIGAWITSAARVRMNEYIAQIPSGHLYYTDTDSLWVDSEGFAALESEGHIHESKLGYLKVVDCHAKVDFRGIKHYVADGRIVRAGVGSARYTSPTRFGHNPSIRHVNADLVLGQPPQPIDAGVALDERSPYRHGAVSEDGWVLPWRIGGKVK